MKYMIVLLMMLLAACSGTREAYQAAEGVDETAKVVAEHYYAIIKEANRLSADGSLSGSELSRAQDLVRRTQPLIGTLASASRAYEAVKSAETEAALQDAISSAVLALSELIDVIKGASRSSVSPELIGRNFAWT